MIGTKLAHYEITSHLGSGSMGEVYRATDSKLGRSVAIQASARRVRDRRPSVCRAYYGLEESGEIRCIVMELVEGETLRESGAVRFRLMKR